MDKKQRIILTMLELVVEQGVNATPMSQVAKEANVAVGTIYHYFENKNQIIEEIYSMICQDFGVVLMANVPENKKFRAQFETMWHNLYNYFVGNPLAFKFIEYVGVPPIITGETRDQNTQYFRPIKKAFLEGISNKQVKDVELKIILQMSFCNVVAAVRLKSNNDLEMDKVQLKDAMEMSWDCIKI